MRRLPLCLIACLALGCGASPYRTLVAPAPTQTTLIRDVSVFTGLDATPLLNRDVVIEGDRITAITPTGEATPAAARVVEGRGRTLLPGYIDAHVHLTSSGAAPGQDVPTDVEHNLHAWLYAGVTTVFDLAGDASTVRDWRDKARDGEIIAPRIYHTHLPITVDDSHPIPLTEALLGAPLSWFVGWVVPTIDEADDAPDLVEDVLDEGADYVKITVDELPPGTAEMSDPLLEALVRAARAQGSRAVVHIGDIHKGRVAADAGASMLAHLPWRTPITDDDAQALAATGIAMTATLAGWHATAALAEGTWQPTALDREIHPAALLDLGAGKGDVDPLIAKAFSATLAARPSWAPTIARLHAAGVTLLVGTDAALPGVYPGSSFHEELRRLVEAGVPPAEVLMGATARAALWAEDTPDYGTVEVGKVADLVLVEGDPLTDITAAAAIVDVWRAGRSIGRRAPADQTKP